MNNSNENDFDRIANQMQDALNEIIGEMHPQWNEKSNSITITKKGALMGIIKMQRAINWCKGHAATRHAMAHLTPNAVDTPALHRCGECNSELQIVRPGKWQCPACH